MENAAKRPTEAQLDSHKSKRPTFSTISQAHVAVRLDLDDIVVTFHKDIACFYSGYFRKAFGGPLLETEVWSISLPDTRADIFRLYQDWLYAQATRHENSTPIDTTETENARYRKPNNNPDWLVPRNYRQETAISAFYGDVFLRLYVFAEVYDVPLLRQDIMTLMVDLERPTGILCQKIDRDALDKSLLSNSPFRIFLLKWMAFVFVGYPLNTTTAADIRKCFSHDWLAEVMWIIASQPKDPHLRERLYDDVKDSCAFHEHQNDWEKILCRRHQAFDTQFYTNFLRNIFNLVSDLDKEYGSPETKKKREKAKAEEQIRVKLEEDIQSSGFESAEEILEEEE